MLIAIDGTSLHWDAAAYAAEMRCSFINQLVASTRERHATYLRGPTLSGIQDRSIAKRAVALIGDWVRVGDRRVLLAGYSRGGAVAIRVAQCLQEAAWARELTVECLALFDAVDRDPLIDAATIPPNVAHAYHALRAPTIGSRSYFGNCGTTIASPGRLIARRFAATHAALGGLPWAGDHPTREGHRGSRPELAYTVIGSNQSAGPGTDYVPPIQVPTITRAADEAASGAVRQWMWGHLRRHGVVT